MQLHASLTPHLRLKVFSLLDTDCLFKLRELNHATHHGTYGISNSGFVQENRDVTIKVHVVNGKCLVKEKTIYASYLTYFLSMGQNLQIKLEADENVTCHSAE